MSENEAYDLGILGEQLIIFLRTMGYELGDHDYAQAQTITCSMMTFLHTVPLSAKKRHEFGELIKRLKVQTKGAKLNQP